MSVPHQYEGYLAKRISQGWTPVLSNESEGVVTDWLYKYAGESVEGGDWSATVGDWEAVGDYTYLIRDQRIATLFKLTWGGR